MPDYQLTPNDIQQVRRHNALIPALLDRVSQLIENCQAVLNRQDTLDDVTREFIEETSRQLDDIEQLLLLEKTGNEESRKAQRTRNRIQGRQDKKELQKLRDEQQRALNAVLLQIAKHGGEIDAPVKLIRQKENLESSIEKIDQDLDI